MRAFNLSSVRKLGEGCSRKAYLMENNLVCKIQRKEDSDTSLGSPGIGLFDYLLYNSKNKKVIKIRERMEKGFSLEYGSKGILTEFLISELIEDRQVSKHFALCKDIQSRKRNKTTVIEIKGLYENAFEKSSSLHIEEKKAFNESVYYGDFPISEDIEIDDVHMENFTEGVVTDYACVRWI